MTDIPRAVLSEQFEERMEGRRLVAAVFTAFRFDPEFFESEILPVFFDMPLSHVPKVRLVQMDDALRKLDDGSIAVYYDRNGLVAGQAGGAKLDVRRHPVPQRNGIFHPKNVIALVEDKKADEDGYQWRSVICACLSANLTRAGWWENVEVAHIEEIPEGALTTMREPLVRYLRRLARKASGPNERANHKAVEAICTHLLGTSTRRRRSVDPALRTHFNEGRLSLVEFIRSVTGNGLKGLNLEIVSPYFEGGMESHALDEIMTAFEPNETRVYLPKDDDGAAQCPEPMFAWIKKRGAKWGSFAKDITSRGKNDDLKERIVHAKVYRFFDCARRGRQVIYCGSNNLTRAGCQDNGGRNWETGFLVELPAEGQPDWWLKVDDARPKKFAKPTYEDEGTVDTGCPLLVRYRWHEHKASVFWDADAASPAVVIESPRSAALLEVGSLAPRTWTDLDTVCAEKLEAALRVTSLVWIVGIGSNLSVVLVQEEGMHARPSLLSELSAAEILRYWALLTPEQRNAFLEARMPTTDESDPLSTKVAPLEGDSGLFDRAAGIFHAFECMHEHVMKSLDAGETREADYRLLGKKYDSLGNLLRQVQRKDGEGGLDELERYLVALCARQLTRAVANKFEEYWGARTEEAREVLDLVSEVMATREAIASSSPEMPKFLDWFEGWFLKRADSLHVGEEAL